MAIISKNKRRTKLRYGSNQIRYGLIYMVITIVALGFLNLYCSNTCQDIFSQSKMASLQEKAGYVASAIGEQDILNPETVKSAIGKVSNLNVTRLIVTDSYGKALYDSITEGNAAGTYCLYPEIVQALLGNDVFTWHYRSGIVEAQASIPILSYNTLVGCVYVMEYDATQGALIQSLQSSVLTISLCLIAAVLIFTLVSSATFTSRLRKIMASIRVIREGDYTHKVHMGGHDELTVLGNEFNDLTDKLQISEDLQKQFISDASHELKTPLASIKLLSDSILQNEMDMDTVREFVCDIGDEADRLNRMSEKLLSLTRVNPDLGEDCEITYLGPTIARVKRMLSAIADHMAVTIRTNIVTDSSILILEDDLYQIIFNLVENSIKYNVPGGRVDIRLTRDDENAILEIQDTGVGIPPDAISHIFERFYRVDKARSRQSGGSGLGLAIVHDMVNRNRGQIRVESQLGENRGTTFTLVFPVFDIEEDLA